MGYVLRELQQHTEAMEIFGMTEEDLAEMDDQLKFEHVVAYTS